MNIVMYYKWLSKSTVFKLLWIFQIVTDINLSDSYIIQTRGGSSGVMVIVDRNGHGDTNSNPGQDWLHFTLH